jgi:NADPH:quinone reductase-like Zn-dependent oxidoreductase
MRVAGIRALGEPVEILEVDEPATLATDEVLIDVAVAGVGNWDELVRLGSWQIGGPPPMALGAEAAGTVAAVGSGVTELREGDEVMTHPLPLRRHGTRAERVVAPAATVASRPPEASWEATAAFPVPALTAAQALDEVLEIEAGGWIVVNGAGGVTGGLLVQLAAARGARVVATASAKKAQRIRDYGASEVLDYHSDWPALVREITGGGAPKAVNAGRGQAATTLRAVADGGRLAPITGDPPPEERGIAVSDVYVRPDGRQLAALAELLAGATLNVPIASVRPVEQAAQGCAKWSPVRTGRSSSHSEPNPTPHCRCASCTGRPRLASSVEKRRRRYVCAAPETARMNATSST